MLVYRFLKLIFPPILRIFYREMRIHGKENLVHKGPLIIVANHPNTLIDPVIIATVVRQQIGFLGKSTLFKPKIAGAILRYFHVIPIHRKIDITQTGTMDNSQSFEKCYQYLEKGGTILIFPEGTSYAEMKLRHLKSGTARIGFEVEERNNFQADVKILPISLNYSDPSRFRTRVTLNVLPAIHLSEYIDHFQEDPQEAVEVVTEHIRKRLQREMILLDDKEEEELLKKVHTIYGSKLLETIPKERRKGKKHDRRTHFWVEQGISKAIRWLHTYHPDRFREAKKDIDNYYDLISRFRMRHGFVSDAFDKFNPTLLFVAYLLYLILTFPIYALGVITNIIPYSIPARVAEKMTHEIEFWSTIMVVVGMFVFPIFYAAEIITFHIFLGHIPWATLLFGLSLPISGLFALDYWLGIERFQGIIRLMRVGGKKGTFYARLKRRKEKLFETLEGIRADFQARPASEKGPATAPKPNLEALEVERLAAEAAKKKKEQE